MTNTALLTPTEYEDGYGTYPIDHSDIVGNVTESSHDSFIAWLSSQSNVSTHVVPVGAVDEDGVPSRVVDLIKWALNKKSLRVPIRVFSVRLTGDQYATTKICTEIGRLYCTDYQNPANNVWIFQRVGAWRFRNIDGVAETIPRSSLLPHDVSIAEPVHLAYPADDNVSDEFFYAVGYGDAGDAGRHFASRVLRFLRSLHHEKSVEKVLAEWLNRGASKGWS